MLHAFMPIATASDGPLKYTFVHGWNWTKRKCPARKHDSFIGAAPLSRRTSIDFLKCKEAQRVYVYL